MRETRLIGLIDDYAIMCVPLEEMCPIEQSIAAERWNNLPYADRVALQRYRDWREKRATFLDMPATERETERLPDIDELEDSLDPLPWLTASDQGFYNGSEGKSPDQWLVLVVMVVILLLSLLCWMGEIRLFSHWCCGR